MSIVSVRRSPDYQPETLYRSVCEHFEAVNLAADLTPDTRVLLKPNLLAARDPSLATTTHPALLAAIAKRLRELGVQNLVLADSPGGLYTPAALRRVYAACDLNTLSEWLTLNEDVTFADVQGFALIQPVVQADLVINCPKLKTHGLTTMSGAVKNLFGCIPGLRKPEIHCLKPSVDSFCEMLIDLSLAVKPALIVMDAVDCMEGNGPGGGTVKTVGYTLCSRDPYALDEAAATLMALPSGMTPPLVRAARQRGLSHPTTVETVGDPLLAAQPPFQLPDAIVKGERLLSVNGLFHRFFGRRRTYPFVRTEKCVGCGQCAESCPKGIIRIANKKAVIGARGCISCFCCQEMCPAHAIDAVARKTRASL